MIAALSALAAAPAASAQPAASDVLVRFRSDAGAAERTVARERANTDFEEALPVRGLQRVDPEPGVSVRDAVATLERSPDVLYAEPNALRRKVATPDDPRFAEQWALHSPGDADIDAPEAWNLTTGSSAVTVAVVDSGIQGSHPDLAPNVSGGHDFVDDDANPDDEDGHGTHVSGTIAARGDDAIGVTGVSWVSKVMPVRVLDENGSGTVADAIRGYAYAADNGAKVINASLGGIGSSQAERDAVASRPNALFVVAAGNEGLNNDLVGSYPCSYNLANIVCVAASGRTDSISSFSNYGAASVDLSAPGEGILSTVPTDGYVAWDGTSMATPHVSGVAALIWSRFPGASVAAVRSALLRGVDVKSGMSNRTATGGRLNAYKALLAAGNSPTPPSPSPPATNPGSTPGSSGPPSAQLPSAAPPPLLSMSSSVRRRQSLFGVLRRGLRVRMGCSLACRMSARALLPRRAARRLRLGSGRRPVRLGASSRSVGQAAGRTLTVRFGRRARARLRRVRSVRIVLELKVLDGSGRSRSAKREVTLRR
ncbi:MAG: S8 family serine peptidase [Actinomycetota bacterium]|nr:S8 family serine peptidase [Actinomycetota bacterium]